MKAREVAAAVGRSYETIRQWRKKAEKKFRKIKGYREIPLLVSSLRKEIDVESVVA